MLQKSFLKNWGGKLNNLIHFYVRYIGKLKKIACCEKKRGWAPPQMLRASAWSFKNRVFCELQLHGLILNTYSAFLWKKRKPFPGKVLVLSKPSKVLMDNRVSLMQILENRSLDFGIKGSNKMYPILHQFYLLHTI